MTYAGRLDPMASGLLLVLSGEEVKKKEKYLKLTKEYELSVLFGFSTDTYDILGKVTHSLIPANSRIDLEKEIKKNLKFFRGKFRQKYPLYSSKTVAGKPLFAYARAGEPVLSPVREVEVLRLRYSGMKKISGRKLLGDIEKRIKKVKGPARNVKDKHSFAGGDFRQKEILKIWRSHLGKNSRAGFFVAYFEIKCSSGTYVRGIANSLGDKIGVPSLALKIKRTKIGKWQEIP